MGILPTNKPKLMPRKRIIRTEKHKYKNKYRGFHIFYMQKNKDNVLTFSLFFFNTKSFINTFILLKKNSYDT